MALISDISFPSEKDVMLIGVCFVCVCVCYVLYDVAVLIDFAVPWRLALEEAHGVKPTHW